MLETVAIVGGGIGGLASAILLSEKGFDVTVYEQARRPQPVGAGFLLQPPGQRVLRSLGVMEDVLKHAVPISSLQSRTLSGRVLLDLKYARLKGKPRSGLGVQRRTIYDALLQKAKTCHGVNIVWDGRVDSCITRANNVQLVVNDTVRDYDLCILSSGTNSTLADHNFHNRVKRPYGWGCLWTTFELPEGLASDVLHQRCYQTRKMMGILPVCKRSDGRYDAALYWSMSSADLAQFSPASFVSLKDELEQFWPDAGPSIGPLCYDDFVAANYQDIWTPQPYAGRLIAIGDVCHATSPQLGQGCTMALLDAWSLALHLNRDAAMLPASLAQWWKSRKRQLTYVRLLSKGLTPLFQSDSVLCELFRDHVMAPLGRLPVFDGLQLTTLASDVLLNAGALQLTD